MTMETGAEFTFCPETADLLNDEIRQIIKHSDISQDTIVDLVNFGEALRECVDRITITIKKYL